MPGLPSSSAAPFEQAENHSIEVSEAATLFAAWNGDPSANCHSETQLDVRSRIVIVDQTLDPNNKLFGSCGRCEIWWSVDTVQLSIRVSHALMNPLNFFFIVEWLYRKGLDNEPSQLETTLDPRTSDVLVLTFLLQQDQDLNSDAAGSPIKVDASLNRGLEFT